MKPALLTSAVLTLAVGCGEGPPAGELQLLGNPDFEDGSVDWVLVRTGTPRIARGDELGVVPVSGTYVAELGGAGGGYDFMFQEVVVPRGASGLELRGFTCVLSEKPDAGGDGPDDTCAVVGRSGSPGYDETYLFSLSGSNWDARPSCDWRRFTLTGRVREGTKIHLDLLASHDDDAPTSCLYDDLELTATYD